MMFNKSRSRKIFEVFNVSFLGFIILVTVSPLILIIASSLSGIDPIIQQRVYFLPVEFTFEGYRQIFADGAIFSAYYNTLWYVTTGVGISLLLTLSAGYALSRRYYTLRSPLMLMVLITMYFSGGLVPSYILINQLGLYDSRLAIILPTAVNAFNLVLARVFMQSAVPEELAEASKIDGANDIQIFAMIAIPLSKAIIAVLALFYGVERWNSWFPEMLYLKNPDYLPLSLFLRRLIILGGSAASTLGAGSDIDKIMFLDPAKFMAIRERMKYGSVIVTMLPIMLVYPFLQKYFEKGIMIGALKE
jgi:putative aldouronate transport system permease protein